MRRGGRVEVMLPVMAADGVVGKIGLSLRSAIIMSWCRYAFWDMAVRVEVAGGAA
jgi:hypothetical protein